ncbi:hypothetical protein FQZ97_544090 [compost metagenome]
MQVALLEGFTQLVAQVVRVPGTGDEAVDHALVHRLEDAAHFGGAAEGHADRFRVDHLDPPQEFHAVHVGQAEAGQHHIDCLGGHQVERRLAGVGDEHPVALQAQCPPQRVEGVGGAIHHQQEALVAVEDVGRQGQRRAFLEKLQAGLGRQRRRVVIALHLVAAGCAQEAQLPNILHPLGDDPDAEVVADGDHRAHQGGAIGFGDHIVDEAAVDLQLAEGEALEVADRRIAGTEIVDGEADALCLERAHFHQGVVGIGHQDVFGQLDLDPVRRDTVDLQQTQHALDEIALGEADGGEVHRHPQPLVEHVAPDAELAADHLEHIEVDGDDPAGFLGQGNELIRADHLATAVPAHQRLETAQAPALQVQLRLVDHHELLVLQAHTGFPLHGQALLHLVVHLRHEGADAVASLVLGLVHRRVGIAQQGDGVAAVAGVAAEADAAADRHLLLVQHHRQGDALLEALQPGHLLAKLVGLHQQHDELVAAQARYGVDLAHPRPQAVGDLDQQLVAGVVAEAVVDHLEAVDVHEGQREAALVARGQGDGLADAVAEQVAVGQAGEAVVVGLVLQLLLVALGFGDVVENADEVADLAAVVHHRRHLEVVPELRAVLAEVAQQRPALLPGHQHPADIVQVRLVALLALEKAAVSPQHFLGRVAGDAFEGRVDVNDRLVGLLVVGDHHRVDAGLHRPRAGTHLQVAAALFGDVLEYHDGALDHLVVVEEGHRRIEDGLVPALEGLDVDDFVARHLPLPHRAHHRPIARRHRLAAVGPPAAILAVALDSARVRPAPDQAALRVAHDQPALPVGHQHAHRQAVQHIAQQRLALRQGLGALLHQLLHALEQAHPSQGHGQLPADGGQGVESLLGPGLGVALHHIEHADDFAAQQQRDARVHRSSGQAGQCRAALDIAGPAQAIADPGMPARAVADAPGESVQVVVAAARAGAGQAHRVLRVTRVGHQQPGAAGVGELEDAPQRSVYHMLLVAGVGQATGEVEQAIEQRIAAGQFIVLDLQLVVQPHALLVGGDQQIEDLLAAGGDEMPLALQHHLHAHLHPLVGAQFQVHQEVADARHQVLLVERLDDEVVGARSQPMHHVTGIGQRGDQDHRDTLGLGRALDLPAQLVAVHFRHHDIADDDGRPPLGDHPQRLDAIAGDTHPAADRFEHVLQLGSLGRAVLHHQDFSIRVHGVSPFYASFAARRSAIRSSRAAMPSGVSTWRAASRPMAACGMESIMALDGSCTSVSAPLRRNAASPSAPSRPMPESWMPMTRSRKFRAAERNM